MTYYCYYIMVTKNITIMKCINDLLFVPKVKTIIVNLWLFGSLSVVFLAMFAFCFYGYGEVNAIGKICKYLAYISIVLFTCACSAYIQIKKEK